jgi:hemolysin activation/secretion protein
MQFRSNGFKWLTRTVIVLVNLTVSALIVAAPNLPDPANLPRLETQPSPPVITSPTIEKKEGETYPAPLQSQSNIQVTINSLKFIGNKNVSNVQLSLLLNGYLGKSIGIKELNQMTALVTHYYRQHGFILAEAYLPEQDITQNTLEIAVVEGYLGELKMQATGNIDEIFLKKMASHDLTNGDAITESNLVKNVTLINSLPAIKAVSELSPGKDVGYSDINIQVQALPKITGFLAANNYGNRFTGREVLSAGIFLNNLAGRGDQLGLNLKTSTDGGQRSAQFGYITPIFEAGTMLNLNAGYSDYRLGGEFSVLDATGHTSYASAFLDQPVLRSRQANITTRFGLSYKDVTDDVSAILLEDHRDISAVEMGLFGDWRDIRLNGFNQLGLNLKFADVNFKNSLAKSLDSIGADTAGNFVKYNLFGSRIQPLSPAYNFIMRAEFQSSNKNLDSSEKLAIGGINRWRDFGELPTSVDRGLIIGLEVRKIMSSATWLASFLPVFKSPEFSPYVFFDYGSGNIDHNALSSDNQVKSSHYGAGVDVQITKKWLLNLTLSRQDSQIEGAASEYETRAWAQIQTGF